MLLMQVEEIFDFCGGGMLKDKLFDISHIFDLV